MESNLENVRDWITVDRRSKLNHYEDACLLKTVARRGWDLWRTEVDEAKYWIHGVGGIHLISASACDGACGLCYELRGSGGRRLIPRWTSPRLTSYRLTSHRLTSHHLTSPHLTSTPPKHLIFLHLPQHAPTSSRSKFRLGPHERETH